MAHIQQPAPYTVLMLVLDTGERLPCLVHTATWLPARIATRWALRPRRLAHQPLTLAGYLRSIARVYAWADQERGINLDDYLIAGHRFDPHDLTDLAAALAHDDDGYLLPGVYDQHLAVIGAFLTWALDPVNRGGPWPRDLDLAGEIRRVEALIADLRIGAARAPRRLPLEPPDVQALRDTIGPPGGDPGCWTWPAAGFSRRVRLRNWLLIGLALALGLRRGELLKLQVEDLIAGNPPQVRIVRRPDDPADPRRIEPAVKSAERVLPVPPDLWAAVGAYLRQPPPARRGRRPNPYLFVTTTGDPLSLAGVDQVIRQAATLSGVEGLCWQRLRHTWAEARATVLLDQPGGEEQLQYEGGWANRASMERYIGQARQRRAADLVLTRHQALFTAGGGA